MTMSKSSWWGQQEPVHTCQTQALSFLWLPHYDSSKHESYVESIQQLQRQHHLEITEPSDDDRITQPYAIWPSWFKIKGSTLLCQLRIGSSLSGQHLVKEPQSIWSSVTMDGELTLASIVAHTTLLQQQPPVFKLAARVAKHWVQSFMDADCYRYVHSRQA